jgi:SAM-dependent methyltransferase
MKINRTFIFNEKEYTYFYNNYNYTWENERSVEVPIILDYVLPFLEKKKRILEVGNVFNRYFRGIEHDCVDAYEKWPGIINQDVCGYTPLFKYDLVFSVSTLEHVGFDYNQNEPYKILRAIEHIKSITKPGGKIIVTLPFGEGVVSEVLRDGRLKFDETFYMKKISVYEWRQCAYEDAKDSKYDAPFHAANSIIIGSYGQ